MIPRLYTTENLHQDVRLNLEKEAIHYLTKVLRLREGAEIHLFNGRDGEWKATLSNIEKKSGALQCLQQLRPQSKSAPITLFCALIKPARFEFLMEKATELGVSHIQPIVTEFCNVRKINKDRIRAQTIEASEQSERLDIPEIFPLLTLREAIARHKGHILWADESREQTACVTKGLAKPDISGLLIGPEGGFSPQEKDFLNAQAHITPIHLGPQILRAETAGIVMLALFQAQTEAWRSTIKLIK